MLSRAAEDARRRGATATEIIVHDESDWSLPLSLNQVLQLYSVVLARATGRHVVVPKPDHIQTWHIFDVLENVSAPSIQHDPCDLKLPPAVPLRTGEMAFPLTQGSVTVRGVTVSMRTVNSDIVFQRGARFLLVGRDCGPPVLSLPFGIRGMFFVSENRRIPIELPESELGHYARDLKDIGTLDELYRRIRESKERGGFRDK